MPERPNILLIISEDMGPWLSCYGEKDVSTPHLDALAAKGVRFTQVWAGGVACSPSRSSTFTGKYAVSLGTETHREGRPVPQWAFFPQYLREAGYYTTNNAKEDYNIKPKWKGMWDASSRKAHYHDRAPRQPFFHAWSSIFTTHLSSLMITDRSSRTIDPASITLPAYLPDEPDLRDDRAWHLDRVQTMDGQAGEMLAELEASGEAANTIVIYTSDHGGCLPGGKGFATEWGFKVPFIMYFPPRWQHLMPQGTKPGAVSDRLISFLDLGPTFCSLAGVPIPDYLAGRAFAGAAEAPARDLLFGYRGINGGRWNPLRTVRDARFQYIHNYLPYRPLGQRQDYQWIVAGQRAWEQAFRAGRTTALQSRFFEPSAAEELYDLAADPQEQINLASNPAYRDVLLRLRARLADTMEEQQDISLIPNSMREPGAYPTFYDRMQAMSAERLRVVVAANLATAEAIASAEMLAPLLSDAFAPVRYYGAVGMARRAYAGQSDRGWEALVPLLNDEGGEVRAAAAEALVRFGRGDLGLPVLLREIVEHRSGDAEAFSAIDNLGPLAASLADDLWALLQKRPKNHFLRSSLVALGRLEYDELYLEPLRLMP